MTFVLFGVLLIVKPIGIALAGGTGPWGGHQVTSLFGTKQSAGFGAVFILIGLFLFLVSRELAKKPEE